MGVPFAGMHDHVYQRHMVRGYVHVSFGIVTAFTFMHSLHRYTPRGTFDADLEAVFDLVLERDPDPVPVSPPPPLVGLALGGAPKLRVLVAVREAVVAGPPPALLLRLAVVAERGVGGHTDGMQYDKLCCVMCSTISA